VLPAQDPLGGQMVQLDRRTRSPQRPGAAERVERQRQRAPRVVAGQHGPAGLVVHDHELVLAQVDAIHPATNRQGGGLHGDGALDPHGFYFGVQPGGVPLHHVPGPATPPLGAGVIGETLGPPTGLR